jgi:hypothetical protein
LVVPEIKDKSPAQYGAASKRLLELTSKNKPKKEELDMEAENKEDEEQNN